MEDKHHVAQFNSTRSRSSPARLRYSAVVVSRVVRTAIVVVREIGDPPFSGLHAGAAPRPPMWHEDGHRHEVVAWYLAAQLHGDLTRAL